jgi:hypothetical protein
VLRALASTLDNIGPRMRNARHGLVTIEIIDNPLDRRKAR